MATLSFDIPDDLINRAGLTERDMKIEIACRLFDAEKISKGEAARLCGLTRDEFDAQLISRNIPTVRYTEQMIQEDLRHATIKLTNDKTGDRN